jgi:hypothetical protein
MDAIVVQRIERDRRPGVDYQARAPEFGPGSYESDPTVDAHAPWLRIAIGDAPARPGGTSEAYVAIAVQPHDTRQARAEACPGHVAREYLIDAPRNPGRQNLQALFTDMCPRDVAGSLDVAVVQDAPLDPRITDVE